MSGVAADLWSCIDETRSKKGVVLFFLFYLKKGALGGGHGCGRFRPVDTAECSRGPEQEHSRAFFLAAESVAILKYISDNSSYKFFHRA
jgi:hypothetical protein